MSFLVLIFGSGTTTQAASWTVSGAGADQKASMVSSATYKELASLKSLVGLGTRVPSRRPSCVSVRERHTFLSMMEVTKCSTDSPIGTHETPAPYHMGPRSCLFGERGNTAFLEIFDAVIKRLYFS